MIRAAPWAGLLNSLRSCGLYEESVIVFYDCIRTRNKICYSKKKLSTICKQKYWENVDKTSGIKSAKFDYISLSGLHIRNVLHLASIKANYAKGVLLV